MVNFDKLPFNVRKILTEELGQSREQIETMTLEECLDAYLKWEGIMGYTSRILAIVKAYKE